MQEDRLPGRRFVPGWIPLLLAILLAVVGLVLMNGEVREAQRERDATVARLRAAQNRIERLLFEAEGLEANVSSLRTREKQLQEGVTACQAAADKSVEVQRLAVQTVDTLTLAVVAVQAGNIQGANQQLNRARSDSGRMNAGVGEANRLLSECRSVLVFTDSG